jgi:hypothetical protein
MKSNKSKKLRLRILSYIFLTLALLLIIVRIFGLETPREDSAPIASFYAISFLMAFGVILSLGARQTKVEEIDTSNHFVIEGEWTSYCPSCFAPIEEKICPNCGEEISQK